MSRKEIQARYRAKHADKLCEYRKANAVKIRERSKQWRLDNPERDKRKP